MPPVLVVDDHVDTCLVMRRLIRRLGVDAECVHSGAEALAFVAEVPPALVILDLSMPDMDGFETLAHLKRSPGTAAVPVIVCSALTDPDSRERALALGAADFWPKAGFTLTEFTRVLSRYVPLDVVDGN